MRRFSLLTIILLVNLLCIRTHSQEIGFIENFALSHDRSSTLSELVPGTEEYYYFYCFCSFLGNYTFRHFNGICISLWNTILCHRR